MLASYDYDSKIIGIKSLLLFFFCVNFGKTLRTAALASISCHFELSCFGAFYGFNYILYPST